MLTPLSEVLAEKGTDLYCIGVDASVAAAVAEMNRRSIGSLLVLEGGELRGIFTERDVLVRVVARGLDPGSVSVGQCMTREPLTVSPETRIDEAMLLVTRRRCRHLPVVANGRILGLVSIGDLTRWLVREREHEIDDLLAYIDGSHGRTARTDTHMAVSD
jgi:CBS domain-containing protein